MDEDEVLELGPSRGGRGRRLTGAFIAVAVVVALGQQVLTRSSRSPSSHSPSTPVRSSAGRSAAPLPAPSRGARSWPTRDGACDNTAYLPLVSAHPLNRTTGIRAMVGDRLATVDVDTGTARPANLPAGKYATALVTAHDGTYALLSPCADTADVPASVVRVGPSGSVRTVSRGPYVQLLAGGNHVWGVLWNEAANTTWLDPLDGTPRRRLPQDFGALGAYGNLIVGTGGVADGPQTGAAILQVLDPVTSHVVRTLGPAAAVMVHDGLVLWTAPGCARCRLHAFDLTTGAFLKTRAEVPATAGLWAGVVSPDRRTVALLQPRRKPVPYATGHPGYPNEIVTLDLRDGALRTVPGVVLFPKSTPGLAFSADGRWLVIGLEEGTGVRLLLWRPGLPGPLQSPVHLTARVAFAPHVAALT